MAIRTIEGGPGPIPVYENVFLIEASDRKEAVDKARKIGEEDVCSNDKLTLNEKPARWVFAGVRKIVSISNPWEYDPDQDKLRPINGTEITYSKFTVSDEKSLKLLVKCEEVEVDYVE
jgi:hypothetical protein